MSTEPLKTAVASTRSVLAGVKKSQLNDATPCAQWNVSQLINHIVGGQFFFTAALNGENIDGEAPDFSAGDFLGEFDTGSKLCLETFAGDGVMEKTVTLPFGEMPGSAFVGLAATDTFAHGWDLAKATGQSTDLSPELAAQLLAGAKKNIPPSFRNDQGHPFGPEQTAPAGASQADQLAAFLGRQT
ncbi:MAG TPA: TIGR03086 family metal-binding protein [Acidimicrobiales bacterium]|nr:TIGR03086 family metal-binding protein [Acidimicrobiales bacterium]